jgi:lysophospholipase L1-like esterase
MGGRASAYTWVRQRPQLMANDLIHFTVPGYQRLAQSFADDMGWKPQTLWLAPTGP